MARETQEFPLVRNFQIARWSATRRAIHDLKKGGTMFLPVSERNNADSSIQRLEEAYEHTRRYHLYNHGPSQILIHRSK